ncbi:hypothetical protein CGCSCA4_v007813 [Colletotrichum siamense]|uniref:Uncharacterized protein n=1 Tax=Colletotrichum siamense TaxID=690259 RepID=A0A9P5K8G7_COLSI|nr:hypothetical protein CGCSCA4_v007813 [Colletotrichum siamense]KAF4863401.1 hypothetical protein CGCSCA2_v002691 [Colletotrichum siamense]
MILLTNKISPNFFLRNKNTREPQTNNKTRCSDSISILASQLWSAPWSPAARITAPCLLRSLTTASQRLLVHTSTRGLLVLTSTRRLQNDTLSYPTKMSRSCSRTTILRRWKRTICAVLKDPMKWGILCFMCIDVTPAGNSFVCRLRLRTVGRELQRLRGRHSDRVSRLKNGGRKGLL